MARKKNIPEESVARAEAAEICGRCSLAGRLFVRGGDGKAVLCSCTKQPGRLFLTGRKGGGDYLFGEPSGGREIVYGFGGHDGKAPGKVVPLFRPGESRPWKCVPCSEIPPGGISFDGSLLLLNNK